MTSIMVIGYVAMGLAGLVLVIGLAYWSARTVIEQLAERTGARFREQLVHDVEAALQRFRVGACEQIVQHGKKSDSLAHLYSTLIDVLRLGREFSAAGTKGDPLQAEKRLRALKETCCNCAELYQRESLHFSPEFCASLEGFLAAQKEVLQAMERELYRKDSNNSEREIKLQWQRLEDRVTGTMDLVRREFHRRNQAPGNQLLQGLGDLPGSSLVPDAGRNA